MGLRMNIKEFRKKLNKKQRRLLEEQTYDKNNCFLTL
jgi:hypothetical protein